jgi:predicted PurR-regulated permease PerM
LRIPPPPPNIATWPLNGKPLSDLWSLASTDLSAALARFAPQLKGAATQLLSAAAAVGLGVLQFFVSIVIAGFVLANSSQGAKVSRKLAIRLVGNRAEEFETLAGATIHSVSTGILGVALIQSVLASLGFLVVRLPGAGLWALMFLIAAVLQVAALALIPAVIYVFATAGTGTAVAFMIWCILVALMDNVLKPLLLGRGLPVPIIVVFLGWPHCSVGWIQAAPRLAGQRHGIDTRLGARLTPCVTEPQQLDRGNPMDWWCSPAEQRLTPHLSGST